MSKNNFTEELRQTIKNIEDFCCGSMNGSDDFLSDFIPKDASLTKQERADLVGTLAVAIWTLKPEDIIDDEVMTRKITMKELEENVRIAKENINKMAGPGWIDFIITNDKTEGFYECCAGNGYEPDGYFEGVCLETIQSIYEDKFGKATEPTPEEQKKFEEHFKPNYD